MLPVRKAKLKEAMDRFRIRVGTDRFSEVKEDYSNLVAGMQWLLLVGSECLNAMGMLLQNLRTWWPRSMDGRMSGRASLHNIMQQLVSY